MQSKQSSFQNPNPKGEIFSSLSSSYTFSGFDSSIQNGKERTLDDNSFSSPSMSRLVHEKNTSSSGLSKPRLVKVRKHLVSSSKGRKVDSGVYNNFFPPASGTSSNGELNGVNPFASNSVEKFDFVFGYDGVSANSNSKTSGLGENVGKSLPDEMMKLNIGRGMNDRVNSNTAGVSDKHETRNFAFGSNMGVPELNPKISGLGDSVGSLPADMRKLNVGKETNDGVDLNSGGVSDKYETRNFAFGSNMRVPELNPKMPGLGDSVGSLPADMRKLKIGKETNDRVNLNLGVGSEKHDNAGFVFGVSQRNSNSSGLDESVGESLSDSVRTLNIGKEANERVVNLKSDEVSKTHNFVFGSSSEGKSVLDRNKASDPATSEKSNDGSKIDEKTFVFGISKKLPDSVPQNTIDKLPNKLNKMKIEDYTVGSEKTKDGSLNSRSSDSFSTSTKNFTDSANGIPGGKLIGEMEKLNVQGYSSVEPQIKSQFFQFGEKKTFDFGSNTNAGSFGGPPVSTVLGEIGKLNIGSTVGGSGIFYDSIGGSSKPPSFTFQGGVQGNSGVAYSEFKLGEASVPSTATAFGSAANNFEIPSVNEANNKPDLNSRSSHEGFGTPQFRAPKQDTSRSFVASVPISTPSSSFSSAAPGVGSVGTTSGVPFLGGDEKKKDFTFISSQDGYGTPNFRAPNQDNLATGFKNLEISARKGGKDTKLHRRKGKAKQNTPVLQRPGKSFVSRESSTEVNTESPGAYSPMDFSPYEETLADDRSSREASMASDEFFNSDIKLPSTDAINARNEGSVTAPGNPNISEGDMKCGELNDSRSWSFKRSDGAKCTTEEFISRPESEFVRSTSEKVDTDVDASLGKFGANTSINIEKKMGGESREFCFSSSSENVSNTSFAFAASPSVQGNSSAPKRLYKKKSQRKVGQDSQLSSSNANINFVIPGIPTFPLSGIGSHSTPGRDKMEESSSFQVTKENHQSETVKKAEVKEISTSGATKVDTAQEACEKWRLRGNQAYAKGNLSKAESYYTRGVNSVAAKDASKSCLNALVLCYSNRAATRMTLGRMREALEDCRAAMLLDPNFLKIQVRAANCHLALGEIEDALRFFRKGVQLGDVCLDRKVVIEASDGLQKAQKIAGDIDRCTELLQQRKSCDAESALTIIKEALIILPYCEKIVQMKAEALFMMRRYEEVVQVCEQTLGSASSNVGVQSENTVGPESIKNSHTRLWCWFMISKSYYNLGRLEEALDFLDKLERVGPIAEKDGTDILKSSISLSVTVRELLRHKTAGNEAFQSGKYSEAVEHYTAAVSCSVESRPFAAICFCNRAAAYQAIGQITDAIADCSLSIALNGDYPKAISRRATLHEMIRDYGKATSDLQRLVSVLENKAEDKANQAGKLGRSSSSSNDLRQARSRLSTMEEEARKEIPLNMYLILGVEPSVDASDIKKAYRKAALRHHPDKAGQFLARSENGDDRLWKEIAEEVHKDADRLFKIIGEAYAILSDSTKRSRYDLEEEIRNSRKRGSGNNSPRRSEPSPYERSGSSRRQWDEFRKSYQSAHWSRSSGRYYDF